MAYCESIRRSKTYASLDKHESREAHARFDLCVPSNYLPTSLLAKYGGRLQNPTPSCSSRVIHPNPTTRADIPVASFRCPQSLLTTKVTTGPSRERGCGKGYHQRVHARLAWTSAASGRSGFPSHSADSTLREKNLQVAADVVQTWVRPHTPLGEVEDQLCHGVTQNDKPPPVKSR